MTGSGVNIHIKITFVYVCSQNMDVGDFIIMFYYSRTSFTSIQHTTGKRLSESARLAEIVMHTQTVLQNNIGVGCIVSGTSENRRG